MGDSTADLVSAGVIGKLKVHVLHVFRSVVFVEISLEPDQDIIVLDGVSDGGELLWHDSVFKEMCDFTPVVTLRLAQATREEGGGILVTDAHIS